jgi:hypothetical protein
VTTASPGFSCDSSTGFLRRLSHRNFTHAGPFALALVFCFRLDCGPALLLRKRNSVTTVTTCCDDRPVPPSPDCHPARPQRLLRLLDWRGRGTGWGSRETRYKPFLPRFRCLSRSTPPHRDFSRGHSAHYVSVGIFVSRRNRFATQTSNVAHTKLLRINNILPVIAHLRGVDAVTPLGKIFFQRAQKTGFARTGISGDHRRGTSFQGRLQTFARGLQGFRIQQLQGRDVFTERQSVRP